MDNTGSSIQRILAQVVPPLIVAAIIAIATKLLTQLSFLSTILLSVGLVAIGLSIYLLVKGEKRKRVRFAWAFVGILVGVILLGIGTWVEHLSGFEFPPAKEGESLIIISTFDRIGRQWQEHVESIIRDALVDTAKSVGFGPGELRVEITKSVLHEDDAKAFGQKYGAAIVIYGESGDFGVKPALKICTAGLEPYSPHAKRIVLTEPDDIAFCILQELPTQSVYLTLFALGVVSYHSETPDYSRAETLFDKAVQIITGQEDWTVDASVAFFFLGNISYHRDSLGQAIAQWKKAIEINPDYAEAHINLGGAYLGKGLLDEAIREYEEALRIEPDYAEAHNNLGVAYLGKGLLDEAIREFKEALRIKPDYAWAHNNLGSAYHGKGLLDDAIRECKEALRIEPDLTGAHYNLGMAYYDKGLLDEAIREYKEALRIEPDYAGAHYNLGMAYYDKGLLDEAIREYKEALRIEPDYAEGHYNLGVAYHDKGLSDEAIREYKEALRIERDYAEAHYNLGLAYYHKDLLDEAIREYKEALRIKPDDAQAHYNLALAYEKTDKSAALEQWQRYLEVARNDPQQQKYIPVVKQRLRELQGK